MKAMKQWLCSLLANYEFKSLTRRRNPKISALLHEWLEQDFGSLQNLLLEFAASHNWAETRELFRFIAESGYIQVLLPSTIPIFLAIDFECHIHSNEPWEFAFASNVGLFFPWRQSEGLIKNAGGFPSRSNDSKEPSITKETCKHRLQRELYRPNIIVVGHNIKRFDLSVLSELGIDVSSLNVLDTLELSLIADPFKRFHRLGGKHRALDDATSTIQLLESLDQIFLESDSELLALFLELSESDPGYRRYFDYLLFRRKIGGIVSDPPVLLNRLQSRAWESVADHSTGPSNHSTRLHADDNRQQIFQAVESEERQGKVFFDIDDPVIPNDFLELDHQPNTEFILPNTRLENWLKHIPRFEHGRLGRVFIASDSDGWISDDFLGSALDATGSSIFPVFQKLYFASWASKTLFQLASEIHPLVYSDLPLLAVRLRYSLEHVPPASIEERLVNYFATIPVIVHGPYSNLFASLEKTRIVCDSLDPEECLESRIECDAPIGAIREVDLETPQVQEWAQRCMRNINSFLLHRDLGGMIHARTFLSMEVMPRDLADQITQDLISCLQNLANVIEKEGDPPGFRTRIATDIHKIISAFNSLGTAPKTNERFVIVLYSDTDNPYNTGIRLYNIATEPYVIRVGSNSIILTEGLRRCSLLHWYAATRNSPVPVPVGEAAANFQVESIPETVVPLPSTLNAQIAIRAHSSLAIKNRLNTDCYILGGDSDQNLIAALVEREFGGNAFHQNWFGSAAATLARVSQTNPSFSFYCDQRGFSETTQLDNPSVILSKLPFPNQARPLIANAIRNFDTQSWNPFEGLLLPLMALRLNRVVAELRSKSEALKIYGADARFSQRTFYRGLINKVLGKVVEGIAESWLDVVPSREEVGKKVLEILESKGLASTLEYNDEAAERTLNYLAGGSGYHLKPEQITVIKNLIEGENTLAILPTGYGKSVCYQIPALLLGEFRSALTVIISPLKALIRNQIDEIERAGYPSATYLSSDLGHEEKWSRNRGVRMGWYSVLYIAPEQLRVRAVQNVLIDRGIDQLIIDEAHCISEWGHEFRPDYLYIPTFLKILSARGHRKTVIGAFTATASPECARDIKELLEIATEARLPANREEIRCAIAPVNEGKGESFSTDSESRWTRLTKFLEENAGKCGILFVHKRNDVDLIAQKLKNSPPMGWRADQIAAYHSAIDDRNRIEIDFIQGTAEQGLSLIVSTIAFGMGINKPDIGFVIHHTPPTTIEDYYQQIGRAARGPEQSANAVCFYDESEWDWKASLGRPITEADCDRLWSFIKSNKEASSNLAFFPIYRYAETAPISADDVRCCLSLLEQNEALKIISAANRSRERFRKVASDLPGGLSDQQTQILSQFETQELISEQDLWAGVQIESMGFDLDRDSFSEDLRVLTRSPGACLERVTQCLLKLTISDDEIRIWIAKQIDNELRFARSLFTIFPKFAAGHRVFVEGRKLTDVLLDCGLTFAEVSAILSTWMSQDLVFCQRGFLKFEIRTAHESFSEHYLGEKANETQKVIENILSQRQPPEDLCTIRTEPERRVAELLCLEGMANFVDDDRQGFGFEVEILKQDFSPRSDIQLSDLNRYWKNKQLRQACMKKLLKADFSSDGIDDFITDYFSRDHLAQIRNEQSKALRGKLNDEQWQAVTAKPDFLLINAAAGTGKTQTLATRILHLHVTESLPMQRILVLTFSKAGESQIRDRLKRLGQELLGSSIFPPVMTFHAFTLKVMRVLGASGLSWIHPDSELIKPVKFKKDDGYWIDVNPILRANAAEILADVSEGFDDQKKLELFSVAIDAVRNGNVDIPEVVLSPDDCPSDGEVRIPDTFGDLNSLKLADVKRVITRYYAEMKRQERIDFAGMVCEAVLALESDTVVLDSVCEGIEHILVDEFQDTSRSQERLIRTLQKRRSSGKRAVRLDVVGDSDQTIFSFNGSSVKNILKFSERNEAAFPGKKTEQINLTRNYRSRPAILDVANHCIQNNDDRLPKVMIAHRDRSQASEPVRLVEARSLPEAAKCLAKRIHLLIADENISPSDIAVIARKNSKYTPMLDDVATELKKKLGSIATEVIQRGSKSKKGKDDLRAFLKSNDDEQITVLVGQLLKQEHLSEREANILYQLEELESEGISTTEEAISYFKDATTAAAEEKGIQFITIHSSKGLEFSHVFLLYLGEKHFPDSRSEIEEERRLLYVGITRAKESLTIVGTFGANPDFFNELTSAPEQSLKRSTYLTADEEGDLDEEGGLETTGGQEVEVEADEDDFDPKSMSRALEILKKKREGRGNAD